MLVLLGGSNHLVGQKLERNHTRKGPGSEILKSVILEMDVTLHYHLVTRFLFNVHIRIKKMRSLQIKWLAPYQEGRESQAKTRIPSLTPAQVVFPLYNYS